MENPERSAVLQRSVLLALEARRRGGGSDAERALRDVLVLLSRPATRVEPDGPVAVVGFSWDGRHLVTGSPSWTSDSGYAWDVRIWDAATGRQTWRISSIELLALSSDGHRLTTATGGTSRVIEIPDGREVGRPIPNGAQNRASMNADGTILVTAGSHGISVASVVTSQEIARIPHEGGANKLAVTPDARRVAIANGGAGAEVWTIADTRSGVHIDCGQPIEAIGFSDDGRYFACGTTSGLQLWELPGGGRLFQADVSNGVKALTFNGDLVGAATGNGRTMLWEVPSGREIHRLPHEDNVTAVAFSHDGTRIVSASIDGTARVFDVASGAELARLTHRDAVDAVAISPDGRLIATGSRDRTAAVWPMDPPDLDAEACRKLSRNMTNEEWTKYFPSEPYRKTCSSLS